MRSPILAALMFTGLSTAFALGQSRQPGAEQPRRTGGPARLAPEAKFLTDVPKHAVDVVLGRPTAGSVTVNVLFYDDAQFYIAYGLRSGELNARTETRQAKAGVPVEVVIDSLKGDMLYYYELRNAASDKTLGAGAAGRFHTQRPPGSTFVFTVQADTHLDGGTSPVLYARTLTNALADEPDFHIDLGDTFMVDKYRDKYREAEKQYLAQRYYFGLLGHSAPLFFVLGNHDGESAWRGGRGTDDIAAWSIQMRKKYFPNPRPGDIYSGNEARQESCGLLEDYYAWEWGDGLFIVLDPYWYTTHKPRPSDDGWTWTLGEKQYQWLQQTLQRSKAQFKFVFIHHLVGGGDSNARGGVEVAKNFEWGGLNLDGSPGFSAMRPGWAKPIHDLLRDAHVTAVFHGHDHFFAKQELDGIIYQLVPQPGHPRANATNMAKDYGYLKGDIINGSGYLRVTVSAPKVTVDFLRTELADGPRPQRPGGESAYSYSIDRAR